MKAYPVSVYLQLVCRSNKVAEAAHRLPLLDLNVLLRRHDVVYVGARCGPVLRGGLEVGFARPV